MRAALEALIARWRQQADAWNNQHPMDHRAAEMLRYCADELAACLDQQKPKVGYGEYIAQLEEAVYWALGERGVFSDEPPPLAGKYRRRFWWRTELRRRAFGEDAVLPSSPEDQSLGVTGVEETYRVIASPDGWQPLETAPKDGTTVLLALNECGLAWVDFGWHNGDYWRNYENDMLSPKHWMPLPAPPTS